MTRARYPSDLSDVQWLVLEPLIPAVKSGGRPAAHTRRERVDGVLYVLRTGCSWRSLPHDFPAWQTVYHSFRVWRLGGTWESVHDALRDQVRTAAGRAVSPSAAIIDSQSVKTTEKGGSVAMTPARR